MTNLSERIMLFHGDITQLQVEAIVTAANQWLLGGGGVDGAVHSASGPQLVAASKQLAPCGAGEARITDGFKLPARFVVHAVGPIYRDGQSGESETLASAYRASLSLACERQLSSIAFPCISTGVYGFPHGPACEVAIKTVIDWLRANVFPQSVTFCCFEPVDHTLYKNRLTELGILEENS